MLNKIRRYKGTFKHHFLVKKIYMYKYIEGKYSVMLVESLSIGILHYFYFFFLLIFYSEYVTHNQKRYIYS